MSFSSIIEKISDRDIEDIYEAIKGKRPPARGLGLIEEMKGTIYTLRSQFLAANNDPAMHRNFVSLYKRSEEQISILETYFRERMEGGAQIHGEGDTLKTMTNMHLLINSLRSFCETLDRGR